MNTYVGKISIHVHKIVSTEGQCGRMVSTQNTFKSHVNTVKICAIPQFCTITNMTLQFLSTQIKINESKNGNECRPLKNHTNHT